MKINLAVATIVLLALMSQNCQSQADTIIDFNELTDYTPGDGSTFYDGYGFNANSDDWTSQGAVFNTTGPFNGGWSYSRVNDTTTPGFTNQFAAITGTGIGGVGNYALAYESEFTGVQPVVTFADPSTVNSVQVTNSTYAFLSMRDGDAFVDEFGGPTGNTPDFFRLTFTGNLQGANTGSVEFFLADYRFADNTMDYIVDEWTEVDLSSLGVVDSISLDFDASQNPGPTSLQIPAYAAFDNFNITAVPEPSSMLALAAVGAGLAAHRRRKKTLPATTV